MLFQSITILPSDHFISRTFLGQFGLVSSLKSKNLSIETIWSIYFVTKLSFLVCIVQYLTNVRRRKFVANGLCRAGRGKSDIELTAWATPCHHEHLFKQRQNGERSSKLIMQGPNQIWMRAQFKRCRESDLAFNLSLSSNFGKHVISKMVCFSRFVESIPCPLARVHFHANGSIEIFQMKQRYFPGRGERDFKMR